MGRVLGGSRYRGAPCSPTHMPQPHVDGAFTVTACCSWLAACVCFLYLLLARRVLEEFV